MEDYEKMMREILILISKEYGSSDAELVKKAYEFAENAHKSQMRESGENYISHPVNVAKIVSDLGMDPPTVCGALLHDVVEDTNTTIEKIREEFGSEIALIVNGLTKIEALEKEDVKFSEIETIRKMIFAMAQDIRVVIVKLADRLHNMRTLDALKPEKQKRKSRQTLEIYAPIANRIGIYTIKRELEDLSFKYLYPKDYHEIKKLVDKKIRERSQEIEYYRKKLEESLRENRVEFIEIDGRSKHFYSIWRKMHTKNKKFSEIYDLFALRILVKDVSRCYTSLGVVHNLWNPIPGRFKDYIASPKSNGYQALHTSVMTNKGDALEIQIRDEKMHHEAEYGMAAHWKYKEGEVKKSEWIGRLVEWQKDYAKGLSGWRDFAKELRLDEVFAFTPKGEIKHLPKGATLIDFAYTIHTDIGNHYAGAIVNGHMVPMGYKIQNGDRIRITVDKNSTGPSLDWLKYAHSSRTRAKIKKQLRERFSKDYMARGREILREIAKKHHVSVEDILIDKKIKHYLDVRHIESEEEFEIRLGEGAITSVQIEKLIEKEKKPKEVQEQHTPAKPEGKEIFVEDLDGIEVHFAKCCNPIPGDPIVGIVTRSHGISIHTADCRNLKGIDRERIVKVSWGIKSDELFEANLGVKAYDRERFLADVMNRIREKHVQIVGVMSYADDVGIAHASIRVNVSGLEQLKDLIEHIRKEKGIIEVRRERGGISEGSGSARYRRKS